MGARRHQCSHGGTGPQAASGYIYTMVPQLRISSAPRRADQDHCRAAEIIVWITCCYCDTRSGAGGPTAAVGTWADMVVAVSSACTFGQAECSAIIETLRATSGLIAGKGGPAERLALKRTTLQNKVHPSASQKNIIRSSELPSSGKSGLPLGLCRLHAANACLFPRRKGKTDLESPDCEVNFSKEKDQTGNGREHHRNKEGTHN
jgi:hypothetical protein